MKLLQVCPYDYDRPGGVQGHIRSLVGEMQRRGHEVRVVAPGPPPQSFQHNGVEVSYLGRRLSVAAGGDRYELSYAGRKERRALVERLRRWGVDLVHFHTIWTPLMPLQLFAAGEWPTVATFHDVPPRTPLGALLRLAFPIMGRLLLSRLDGAIAVSQGPMRHLRPGRGGVRPHVVPPAVDLSLFADLDKTARGPKDPVRVLFVGRLEPRKGVACLLDAWQRIDALAQERRGRRAFELIVAGSGKLAPVVENAVRATARTAIRLAPADSPPAVARLLAESDILVAPSLDEESFGLVLVEALASATPVIASRNGGYAGILEGAGSECLVPPGDAGALADAILWLADDAAARRRLARWGRAHVRRFDIRAIAGAIEAVYDEALQRRRRRASGGAPAPAAQR